jgi:hypothetical protein
MASLRDLFIGSEYDNVPRDTETLLEQETSGLRLNSLVEINNPLIYGSDSIRIATKSTPTLNTMKQATQGELSSGGLLGRGLAKLTGGKLTSLDDARNSINDFLGIPSPLIPTRVASKIQLGKSVQEVIDEKNGTEFGKFLQQTGGGTPSTIAKQALGKTIQIAKRKATKFLLGSAGEIGLNLPLPTGEGTTGPDFVGINTNTTYTEYTKEVYTELAGQDIRTPDELNQQYATRFPSIDLAYHSPIYGVQRGSKLDNSDLGFQTKKNSTYDSNTKGLSNYDPLRKYTETSEGVADNSLEARYGLTNESDRINSTSVSSEYDSTELEKSDLVPFWISKFGEVKRTHFRTLITGLSETVTPSWNSSKFFGNPYSYHTYGGVERSVTFNLFIYCMNPIELANNWEKVNQLTQYTYPSINQASGLVNPPVIQFRIGDMYNGKNGYITSLSYTFPDNGTWETDLDGFKLPKFIDVNITIDFIEQIGSEKNLYSYNKSKAAISELNSDNEFNTTQQSGNGSSVTSGVNKFGDSVIKLNIPTLPIKNINTGDKIVLPSQTELGIPKITGQSGINEVSEAELARVYRIPNAEAKRELKFLGKGQTNTGLV